MQNYKEEKLMFFKKKKKPEYIAENVNDEIASLKKQVESLLNERVTPAIANAADKAEHVVHNAKEMTDCQMKQVSDKVQSRPLMAIGIAVIIGCFIGKIIR